jgi:hypothetical protein
MNQQHLSSPNGTHEGDTPGERVTLSIPIHLATSTRATVVREGPKPARPAGRIPRVARILAQAHHFQNLLDAGVIRTQMELAELTKLTTARITQIMNLLVTGRSSFRTLRVRCAVAPSYSVPRMPKSSTASAYP